MAALPPTPEPDVAPPADRPSGRRRLHILHLLPNLVTILALCAGLTAIRLAMEGRVGLAIAAIGFAAALDALDGRLARMLKSESAIGAELDSLGDFVNFGVAPAMVLYHWGLRAETSLGWIAVLVYVVCCMLRLARFNVGNRNPDGGEKATFIGVPSPAGAMLVLAPIYFTFMLDGRVQLYEEAVAIWMLLAGGLMIGRFRTPSLKRVTFYAENAPFILLGSVVLVAALLTYPWTTLLALDVAYLVAIILAQRRSTP